MPHRNAEPTRIIRPKQSGLVIPPRFLVDHATLEGKTSTEIAAIHKTLDNPVSRQAEPELKFRITAEQFNMFADLIKQPGFVGYMLQHSAELTEAVSTSTYANLYFRHKNPILDGICEWRYRQSRLHRSMTCAKDKGNGNFLAPDVQFRNEYELATTGFRPDELIKQHAMLKNVMKNAEGVENFTPFAFVLVRRVALPFVVPIHDGAVPRLGQKKLNTQLEVCVDRVQTFAYDKVYMMPDGCIDLDRMIADTKSGRFKPLNTTYEAELEFQGYINKRIAQQFAASKRQILLTKEGAMLTLFPSLVMGEHIDMFTGSKGERARSITAHTAAVREPFYARAAETALLDHIHPLHVPKVLRDRAAANQQEIIRHLSLVA